MFGLAPGADWPFHQIPRRPHHQVNHRIIHELCRFCSSAKTLALPACAGSRFRVREDFPQQPKRSPSTVHLRPANQHVFAHGYKLCPLYTIDLFAGKDQETDFSGEP
jgi:hypothetical protein